MCVCLWCGVWMGKLGVCVEPTHTFFLAHPSSPMTIPALPVATQVRWTGATCGPYTVRTRWAFGLSPAESGTHTPHYTTHRGCEPWLFLFLVCSADSYRLSIGRVSSWTVPAFYTTPGLMRRGEMGVWEGRWFTAAQLRPGGGNMKSKIREVNNEPTLN